MFSSHKGPSGWLLTSQYLLFYDLRYHHQGGVLWYEEVRWEQRWEWKPWGASTSSQTCYLITSCVTSHEGIFEISSRIHSTRHHQRCNSMLNTFLFSAVHLGMQLNTGQDELEVAHYKPGEEAGDKLIMETGHLSDLLRGKLCPILTPSPILHPAGPYLLAAQVFLSSTIHTFVLL